MDNPPDAERSAPSQALGSRVRVMVVDDEMLVRRGLDAILRSDPLIDVVAATDGVGAVTELSRHRVDVVLLDLHMPEVDGMQVLATVRKMATPPVVAILTSFDADESVAAALAAGAAGYLLKDTEPELLTRQVRALGAGGTVLSAGVTGTVIDGFLQGRPSAEDRTKLQQLSARQLEVLALIGCGDTNAEIAAKLYLSVATVKDHVTAILARLELDNRVRAALFAVRSGLVTGSSTGG